VELQEILMLEQLCLDKEYNYRVTSKVYL